MTASLYSLPCCDVIKIDLITKQDGGRLVSFNLSFNISETEHATKKLTTDITITPKVLMDKPIRKYIAIYPFNVKSWATAHGWYPDIPVSAYTAKNYEL